MLKGLSSDDVPIRLDAVEALRQHAKNDAHALRNTEFSSALFHELRPRLTDHNPNVLLAALQLLAELAAGHMQQDEMWGMSPVEGGIGRMLPDIVRSLGHHKLTIRREALRVLTNFLQHATEQEHLMSALVRYGFESEDWRVRKESAEAIPMLLTRDAGGVDLVRLVAALVGRLRDVSDVVIHGAITALVHVRNVVGQDALLEYVKQLNGLSRQLFKQHQDRILSPQAGGSLNTATAVQQPWTEAAILNSATPRPRRTDSASYHTPSDLINHFRSDTPSSTSQLYPTHSHLPYPHQPLDFGIVPQTISQTLLTTTDYKLRTPAIDALHRCITNITDIAPLLPHLHPFLTFLSTLLTDPNFTIALTTLHTLRETIAKIGPAIKPYLATITTPLVQKFAETKTLIRQTAMKIIVQLMYISTPKPIIALCLHHLSHPSPRVREELINIVTTALLTFPDFDWELPLLIADLLTGLRDTRARVKFVTVEAYSVIAAMITPDRLVRMLREYGVEEDTVLVLRGRFEGGELCALGPEGLVEHLISRSQTGTPRPPSSVPVEGAGSAGGQGQGHGMVGVGLMAVTPPQPDRTKSAPVVNLRLGIGDSAGVNSGSDGGGDMRRYSASNAKPGILRTTKLPWEKTPNGRRDSRQRHSYHEGRTLQPSPILPLPMSPLTELKRSRSLSESDMPGSESDPNRRDSSTVAPPPSGVISVPAEDMSVEGNAVPVHPAVRNGNPPTGVMPERSTTRQLVPVRRSQTYQTGGVNYLATYQGNDENGLRIEGRNEANEDAERSRHFGRGAGKAEMTDAIVGYTNGAHDSSEYGSAQSQWEQPPSAPSPQHQQPIIVGLRSSSRAYTQRPLELGYGDVGETVASPVEVETYTPSPPASVHKRQLSEATRKRMEEKEKAQEKRRQSSIQSAPTPLPSSTNETNSQSTQHHPSTSHTPPPLPKSPSTTTIPTRTPQPSQTPPPQQQRTPSTRALTETFRQSYTTLRAPTDWTHLATALQTLLTLLPQYPQPLLSTLHDLILTLTPHIHNLRTSVSKLAISLVGEMYVVLGRAMEAELDITVMALLKKIGEAGGGGFIVEECDNALQKLCSSSAVSQTRIITTLLNNTDHKNPIVRSRVSSLLAQIVPSLSDAVIQQKYLTPHQGETDRFWACISAFLREGVRESRVGARVVVGRCRGVEGFEKCVERVLGGQGREDVWECVRGLEGGGVGGMGLGAGLGGRRGSLRRVGSLRKWGSNGTVTPEDGGVGMATDGAQSPAPLTRSLTRARSLRTSRASISQNDHLTSLYRDLSSEDWTTRLQTLSTVLEYTRAHAAEICPAGGGDRQGCLQPLYDALLERCKDGNVKVGVRAVGVLGECLGCFAPTPAPLLPPLLQTLYPLLASSSPLLRTQTYTTLQTLTNPTTTDPTHLLPHITNLLKFSPSSNIKVKLGLLETLSMIIRSGGVSEAGLKQYCVPVCVGMLVGDRDCVRREEVRGLVGECLRGLGEVLGVEEVVEG
ncbi:hypothetical protein HDV00_008482, partial [Rhizophlyctis rosea]